MKRRLSDRVSLDSIHLKTRKVSPGKKKAWVMVLRRIQRKMRMALKEQGIEEPPVGSIINFAAIVRKIGPCPGGNRSGRKWTVGNVVALSQFDLNDPVQCSAAMVPSNFLWARREGLTPPKSCKEDARRKIEEVKRGVAILLPEAIGIHQGIMAGAIPILDDSEDA